MYVVNKMITLWLDVEYELIEFNPVSCRVKSISGLFHDLGHSRGLNSFSGRSLLFQTTRLAFPSKKLFLAKIQLVERNIWNPLVYIADMLKKLSGSEQLYLVNVKILLM